MWGSQSDMFQQKQFMSELVVFGSEKNGMVKKQ